MTNKWVLFERRFKILEKELRKNPDDEVIIADLSKLQADFDNYVKKRI